MNDKIKKALIKMYNNREFIKICDSCKSRSEKRKAWKDWAFVEKLVEKRLCILASSNILNHLKSTEVLKNLLVHITSEN